MEIGNIVEFLRDKTIFVTGSTGFLGKIFVEKVLRVQPNVKKLFLLVRADDAEVAKRRVLTDVIAKELFDALREKHGIGFDAFVSEKVNPVAGDIVCENLGIEDYDLMKELYKEIDIVVNVAATTNFYERYDVALNINVLGAKHVMEFAKNCTEIKMLLHVSTAYVVGEREGIISEKPFQFGETLVEGEYLDIEEELKLIVHRKEELKMKKSTKDAEKSSMKELGIKRARMFGWPNTYVFTKAMGEMLLGHLRGELPLVIMRPTIITSIYKDLLPGWMEGIRTIDNLILGYAKGKISCFLGDPDVNLDLIPGDIVVNAMIVAIAVNSNKKAQIIYHVTSSFTNMVNCSKLAQCTYDYMLKNPRMTNEGKAIKMSKFRIMKSMSSFHILMILRYRLPLLGLFFINFAMCGLCSNLLKKMWKEYNLVMQFSEIYRPYTFFKGIFEDVNLEGLRMTMVKCDDTTLLDFDPKNIDWDDYLISIHIPSILTKYLCK
ncbi:hypothetical protein HPP92_006799 [Vanilla planifolia]|uniref:Fatty acyl-CoA reductase n=1 Tax=Vanilla planifolia TaxID=51239 RepID=A0A835V825_VANPL|nr:hypothetical protein HPP92_006799 [Vanilla planifolia]